jgi:acyl-CoA hydrolase
MSNLDAIYRSKRITHEELIARLKPGDLVSFGTWLGQSYGVMRAIAQYGRGIDPLYVSISHATGAAEFLELPNVYCLSSFLGPFERTARRNRQNVFYTPMQYTDAYQAVRANRPIDFLVKHVTPMDERGYFNLSLNSSWEHDAIHWLSQHAPATRVVFEVNRNLPRVRGLEPFGNNEIHVSEVDCIVEYEAPLYQLATPPPTETEKAIAANVARLVEDRATIQLGFGSIPMVIGKLLADRRDLGIHSEMFCQAHVDLIEAGAVTNVHKGLYDGLSVATFALGEDRLYRWLADNPAFAMLPVEEVNAVPVLARVRRMTSINSMLTIDLSGQACAHCLGAQTYSGLGGAFEFAFGAQLSPGGKSIICLPSTKTLRDGREVSNIVACHPPGTRITLPEHCVDWVVTEYGGVRLKFLNLEWRAKALIGIAHPKYREELAREAAANGLDLAKLANHRRPSEQFFSQA